MVPPLGWIFCYSMKKIRTALRTYLRQDQRSFSQHSGCSATAVKQAQQKIREKCTRIPDFRLISIFLYFTSFFYQKLGWWVGFGSILLSWTHLLLRRTTCLFQNLSVWIRNGKYVFIFYIRIVYISPVANFWRLWIRFPSPPSRLRAVSEASRVCTFSQHSAPIGNRGKGRAI